jgi:Fur family ferric uptake transcriptional regulator
MKDASQIDPLLSRAGLRRTPVRAGVLEVLAKTNRPLGAVDILAKLPPHTDAVTVYRTLNTLTKKKLLHRVRGEDRIWRYALEDQRAPSPHQHPHFVCEQCGKVECLSAAHVPTTLAATMGVTNLPAPGAGYRVSYAEVVLHGLCPKCQ